MTTLVCDGSYGIRVTFGDSTQLIYLRSRWYNPADGRFQSRDTWNGDTNRPLSLNRWMYVEGNPINITDPSGNKPPPPRSHTNSMGPWCLPWDSARADFAEQYVKNIDMDEMNTYTAAGIGVQCWGTNYNTDSEHSGEGIAQISDAQASESYGKEITVTNKNGEKVHRGYGLLCWIKKNAGIDQGCECLSEEKMIEKYGENFKDIFDLEKADQNKPKWAVKLMRRRIQIVMDKCESCNDTDKFIVAALAQNGPGFNKGTLKNVYTWSQNKNDLDWKNWYENAQMSEQSRIEYPHQLRIFYGVILELQSDGYYLPPNLNLLDIDINYLMSK